LFSFDVAPSLKRKKSQKKNSPVSDPVRPRGPQEQVQLLARPLAVGLLLPRFDVPVKKRVRVGPQLGRGERASLGPTLLALELFSRRD